MPIASSSAMCLSRATGSRPVQPAMTAWSIGSVSGVAAPLSCDGEGRDQTRMASSIPAASSKMRRSAPPAAASISPTGTSPSRWHGSEIAQPSIMLISVQLRSARRFCLGERLVVGEVGDHGRRIGGGRHHQRVIGREARVGARDERAARAEQIDVVGGADAFAAQDAHATRGDRRRRPCWRSDSGARHSFPPRQSRPWLFIGADVEEFRHLDPLDQRALARQRLQRALEGLAPPRRRDRRARPWSAPPAACP